MWRCRCCMGDLACKVILTKVYNILVDPNNYYIVNWGIGTKLQEMLDAGYGDGDVDIDFKVMKVIDQHDLSIMTRLLRDSCSTITIFGSDTPLTAQNSLMRLYSGLHVKRSINRLTNCPYLYAELACAQSYIRQHYSSYDSLETIGEIIYGFKQVGVHD